MRWTEIILTSFAALSPLTAIVGGIVFYQQNKARKNLEIVREKQLIELDETTHNNLIQEAASINQEREQRREEWWATQITILRTEIEAERQLSNRRFRRLNQLEDWATRHIAWDHKAWTRIRETDPDFEPPPTLPEEIFLEVASRRGTEENGAPL